MTKPDERADVSAVLPERLVMIVIGIVALVLLVVVSVLAWPHLTGSRPQHAGAGEGALTVEALTRRDTPDPPPDPLRWSVSGLLCGYGTDTTVELVDPVDEGSPGQPACRT